MELKLAHILKQLFYACTFNQTRMELKRNPVSQDLMEQEAFNQTRMELKLLFIA